MPRGYRLVVVAVVGWLSLAASEAPQPKVKPEQPKPSSDISNAANTVSAAIMQAAKPAEQDRGCQQGHDERHSDLCAQWEAVDSARDSARYAKWSIWLGAIGTGLLVWTLWETRRTSRRELRAYVYLEKAQFEIGDIVNDGMGAVFKLSFQLKNFGQTPAIGPQSAVCYGVDNYPVRSLEDVLTEGGRVDDIPPGHISPHYVEITLAGRAIAAIQAGTEAIYITVRTTYRDVFNESRVTSFSLVTSGSYFKNGMFQPVADKGSAT